MSSFVDREPASDQTLENRRMAMSSVGRHFLEEHPDAIACVYVGSALRVAEPGDTDLVIVAKRSFTMTPEEVDRATWMEHRDAGLPHPDTFDVVKIVSGSKIINIEAVLPEPCPYGVFVVSR